MNSVIKRHWKLAAIIFVFYFTFVVLISNFFTTFRAVLIYSDTLNWGKFGFSLLLGIMIGALVSYNCVLVWDHHKRRKACKKGGLIAGVGTVGGLITGVCPLCVGGLFPLLFGLFGISFSLGVLPFGGIEVQVLAILLLGISIHILSKKNRA